MATITEDFLEGLNAQARAACGMTRLNDEQMFDMVHRVLCLMPTERMKALVSRCAASPKKLDQLKSQQLAVLLFAQAEVNRLLLDLPPDDVADICREVLEGGLA